MIKKTVSFYEFCDSFGDSYKDNFSYHGKRALFDYLEQLSEDIGEDIELDTVALCCEYQEVLEQDIPCKAEEYYEFSYSSEDLEEEEKIQEAKDFLQNHTTVIEYSEPDYSASIKGDVITSGIIMQNY